MSLLLILMICFAAIWIVVSYCYLYSITFNMIKIKLLCLYYKVIKKEKFVLLQWQNKNNNYHYLYFETEKTLDILSDKNKEDKTTLFDEITHYNIKINNLSIKSNRSEVFLCDNNNQLLIGKIIPDTFSSNKFIIHDQKIFDKLLFPLIKIQTLINKQKEDNSNKLKNNFYKKIDL